MNTIFKSLTAVAVAGTIAMASLSAPAEAKVRGKDVAIGLAIGLTALAIASGGVDAGPPPRRRGGPRRRGCGWLKRKAIDTGSPYWWDRYYDCKGGY